MKPLQPQIFNLLKQVRYRCHFCKPDKKKDLEAEGQEEKYYTPQKLRKHLMNDCNQCCQTMSAVNALDFEDDGVRAPTCNDCGFTSYNNHECKAKKLEKLGI